MKLNDLKFVIKSLIEKMTCPFCKKSVNEANVNIIQLIQNRCALQVRCQHCQKETIVNADIQKRKIPLAQKPTTNEKKAFNLEKLANFSQNLENLKGDLKDLL